MDGMDLPAWSSRDPHDTHRGLGDVMKLKLRTSRHLYTIKLESAEGKELLKKINCPKKEV